MTSRARFGAAVCKGTTGRSRGSTRCRRYLYSTWASTDTSYLDATANGMVFSADRFLAPLANSPLRTTPPLSGQPTRMAAFERFAPVGDAWARAWLEGVANPDPYAGSAPGVALSFGYQPGSEPGTRKYQQTRAFTTPASMVHTTTVCNSRRSQGGLLASSARTRRPLYS